MNTSEKQVVFVCQRCHQLIKLDKSFSNCTNQDVLDRLRRESAEQRSGKKLVCEELTAPVFYDEACESILAEEIASTGKLHDSDDEKHDDKSDKCDEHLPQRTTFCHDGEPMIASYDVRKLIEDNKSDPEKKFDLFNMLGEPCDIDHPLCEKCADSLIEDIELEAKKYEQSIKEMKEFFDDFDPSNVGAMACSIDDLKVDLEKANREHDDLEKESKTLDDQIKEAEENIKKLRQEDEQLEENVSKVFAQRAEISEKMYNVQEQLDANHALIRVQKRRLEKLCNTNVFNEAFHIMAQDQYGKINGLRLGSSKGSQIDWPELNAAWGETALLVHCLANKLNFKFQRYEIVPFGSNSYIKVLNKNDTYPLYSGFRLIRNTRFDSAMMAFLDMVNQLQELIETRDINFKLPYKIDVQAGKIYDPHNRSAAYSIKPTFTPPEQWTRALKWMLTNLKWALTWVVHLQATEKPVVNRASESVENIGK